MLLNSANAQEVVAAAAGNTGFLMQVAPFLPILVIFYFFMIRPQQKRAKEHQNLMSNLKKGDQVVTSGGFIAAVVKNEESDPFMIVELADNIRARMKKDSIAGLFDSPQQATLAAEKKPNKAKKSSKTTKAKATKAAK